MKIKKASAHNLKNVDVRLPRENVVVITGVSGSGKSSLAFETIFREGQRRYLASVSSYARQFVSKFGRGEAESVEGLSPAVSVDQKTISHNPRSTVGTMTEVNDHLRLLYSRLGSGEKRHNSSFFSFNSPNGACPSCRGLGVEDRIDPDLFVAKPEKSLREGALGLTTPSGYIVYSQVTMDVLDMVCGSHGFSVDKPFEDLTREERDVVFYGSNRIVIPFGKHPLESRLKWKGITPRPREEGHYKGIVPVMEEILRRDRNKNILRFARSVTCGECGGSRLKKEALEVAIGGRNIAEVTAMSIDDLADFVSSLALECADAVVAKPIEERIREKIRILKNLELGYLSLDRESTTLSGGEAKRIRLANQVIGGLGGVVYVLDEPTVGLHPRDTERLFSVFEELSAMGNTVIVVEHDEYIMGRADWLVDVGPGAGPMGGEILFEGPPEELTRKPDMEKSATWSFLTGREKMPSPKSCRAGTGEIIVRGATHFNLKNLDAVFKKGALNVVTGVSGSGKSTLVIETLGRALEAKLNGAEKTPGACYTEGSLRALEGIEGIKKIIKVDQKPIGRTPRSNPATYTDLFDMIRDIYASLPDSKKRGWKKGRFSFNVKGGRCEACEGASVKRIRMHFMEDVEIPCEECDGNRFNESTLEVVYKGKNIAEVLRMSVDEAADFFSGSPKIYRCLKTLQDVGLGYLLLGQPSTTLSGGEAERVKLAAEFGPGSAEHTLYLLDEPTTGLHSADVKVFLGVVNRIVDSGNTVIVIEHNLDFVRAADWVVDLGPEGGASGGEIMVMGPPEAVEKCVMSPMGRALRKSARVQNSGHEKTPSNDSKNAREGSRKIRLRGVSTNNLKALDVDLPHGKTTVITGRSGSGKSSLAVDTLYGEARRRFSESMSTHARRYFKQIPKPPIVDARGLTPAISIGHEMPRDNPRSTVATVTEIYDRLRLLYSRAGKSETGEFLTSQMFSFNSHLGACKTCDGLGVITRCDPRKLVSDDQKSLFDGAMDGHKTGRFYGERGGRYLAILETVGRDLGIDFSKPWRDLKSRERKTAMGGTGEKEYLVLWKYNRKGRKGQHTYKTTFMGFAGYVDEEYARVHGDKRGENMRVLMRDEVCPACDGERLREPMKNVRFAGYRMGEMVAMTVEDAEAFFRRLETDGDHVLLGDAEAQVSAGLGRDISHRLRLMVAAGLGYLQLSRPISTLSNGERRRLGLVSNLGADLSGTTYVLDEPTVGLHGRDTEKILGIIGKLRKNDNTVIVVENDESFLRGADHILELGPGSGREGGRIVARGSPSEMAEQTETLSAGVLNGHIPMGARPGNRTLEEGVRVVGAFLHNLDSINVHFPKGGITAVTGVSGSGKTTLVFDVLLESLLSTEPVGCKGIVGGESIGHLVAMDQTPIGRSPASNPATYTGIFEGVRNLYARAPLARERGMGKGSFSFNSKNGRCERCKGAGHIQVEMGFLADVWIPCEVCEGSRYRGEILEVKYRGKSVADVLEMTAGEAAEFFRDEAGLGDSLGVLVRVGLGYLPLGQSALTLSSGESERLKLARELVAAGRRDKTPASPGLYVFDEPTVGLHPADIVLLLDVFYDIVDAGNSVIVLEHNLDVISSADWVIDLGPEGGNCGGQVVAVGPPSRVLESPASWTGKLLKERI